MKLSALCNRILIPLFLPYALFIGCSVVGAVVGGASRPALEGHVTSTLGLDSIVLGTEVQLVMYDRVTIEGEYGGLVVYPGKLYADRYASTVSHAAYRGFIPGLEQRVTLRETGGSFEGYFKGVDRGAILFQPDAGSDTVIVSPEDVVGFRASDSLSVDGKSVRRLIRDGTMIGRRVITLHVGNADQMFPYESVEVVLVKGHASGMLTGFLIGAVVDVTALILAASAESDCQHGTSDAVNRSQSCGRR
ncbi:MAG TPA: hypothetical protein VMF59_03065 [Bacteroidota bacterium]|nr:hypothetical protein [Bacteroidota bacterium]